MGNWGERMDKWMADNIGLAYKIITFNLYAVVLMELVTVGLIVYFRIYLPLQAWSAR